MQPSNLSLADPADEALKQSFAELSGDVIRLAGDEEVRICAVVDGAFFEDLPVLLG